MSHLSGGSIDHVHWIDQKYKCCKTKNIYSSCIAPITSITRKIFKNSFHSEDIQILKSSFL